jgi:hypothetical protein
VESASPTDLPVIDGLKLSLQKVVYDFADGVSFRSVVHIDSHLPEPHQGSHAYAPDDDRIRSVAVEKIDRRLASSLHMRWIVNNGDIPDFPVLNVD